jgi:hypothetical protein
MGSRAGLDAVEKRKIPSPRRESNPGTSIVQPVANWATSVLFQEMGCHTDKHLKIWGFHGGEVEVFWVVTPRSVVATRVSEDLAAFIFKEKWSEVMEIA